MANFYTYDLRNTSGNIISGTPDVVRIYIRDGYRLEVALVDVTAINPNMEITINGFSFNFGDALTSVVNGDQTHIWNWGLSFPGVQGLYNYLETNGSVFNISTTDLDLNVPYSEYTKNGSTWDLISWGEVKEAPSDNAQYIRKNKGWSVLAAVEEAPPGSLEYTRSNGGWKVVEHIPEVLDDTKSYVRKYGQWVEAYFAGGPKFKTYEYTATEGQSVFSGVDNNGETLLISNNVNVQCYLNGYLLKLGDATITSTTITLTNSVTLNSSLSFIEYL